MVEWRLYYYQDHAMSYRMRDLPYISHATMDSGSARGRERRSLESIIMIYFGLYLCVRNHSEEPYPRVFYCCRKTVILKCK